MNRIIFPWPIYPLIGDVVSQPGTQIVQVEGLRTIPIAPFNLQGGEYLEYNINDGEWEATLRASVQVNNVTASDDNIIAVNVPKISLVNGV